MYFNKTAQIFSTFYPLSSSGKHVLFNNMLPNNECVLKIEFKWMNNYVL